MNPQLEDWLKRLDEIDLDLDLGKGNEEAAAFLEKQKAAFKELVQDIRARLEEAEESERGQQLKAKLDDLQVQLALGKADTEDALKEQQQKLENAVNDVRANYLTWREKTLDTVESGIDKLSAEVEKVITNLESQLDRLRVQLALGKAEAGDELADTRAELRQKVREIREKIEARADDAEARWDQFNEELNESYTHLKSALRKLWN